MAAKNNENGYPIPEIDDDGKRCRVLMGIKNDQPRLLQSADADLICRSFYGCKGCRVIMYYLTSDNERLGLKPDESRYDEMADLHSGGTAC